MHEQVLIVGAGPVGLTLALDLARRGIRARIIDKHATPSPYCRAIGVTPRSLEVFEDLGMVRDIIDASLWLDGTRMIVPGQPVREIRRDLSDLPYAQLGVPQYETERVLTEHLARHGVDVERGVALTGLAQTAEGVAVELEGPQGQEQASFRFVVGCDGAHSMVRRALDINFIGEAWPFDFMLGDVHIDWDVPCGIATLAIHPMEDAPPDMFVAIPLPERGRYRVSAIAPPRLATPPGQGTGHGIQADRPGATLADLQEVADRLLPEPSKLSDMRWSSIFRISMRLAEHYRVGNAFIAGDAAHVHPPTGGQGMNTGIQDAYNLGWKLALVLEGKADPALLDSYEVERQPVAEQVIARTIEQSMNISKRGTGDRLEDTQVLVSYRGGPLAGEATGEGLAAGDRMPDVQGLRRHGIGYPLRLFDVLRGTCFTLLVPVGSDIAPVEALAALLEKRWPGLVRIVAIAPADAKIGEVPGIELLFDQANSFAATFSLTACWLVRPDNYISWRGDTASLASAETYLARIICLR